MTCLKYSIVLLPACCSPWPPRRPWLRTLRRRAIRAAAGTTVPCRADLRVPAAPKGRAARAATRRCGWPSWAS